MPYKSIKDLSPQVKKSVPRNLWSLWMKVFNSCYYRHGKDDICFRQAHSAVNRAEKGDG